jgi:predicted anti-sigma-YlaC factor YlaD
MTCPTAEPLSACYADDPSALGSSERAQLELHLGVCEACRVVLDDQRQVARMLHARPPVAIPPDFAARLAVRLDAEPHGWLAIANWRAWTVTLAPVAAALVLIAWLGGSSATQSSVAPQASAETFETVTAARVGEPAAVFLQSSRGDLVEAVLTGAAASPGDSDGR